MLLFFYTTTRCAIIMPIRNPYIDDMAAEAIGGEEVVGENEEEVSNGEDDPEESELSITSIFLILHVLMWYSPIPDYNDDIEVNEIRGHFYVNHAVEAADAQEQAAGIAQWHVSYH